MADSDPPSEPETLRSSRNRQPNASPPPAPVDPPHPVALEAIVRLKVIVRVRVEP